MRSAGPPSPPAEDPRACVPAARRRAGPRALAWVAVVAAALSGLAAAPAAAQDAPIAAAPAPTTVWAKGAVQATRFPDSAAVTLTAADGDALSVVAAWDGRFRVRRGLEFGWVSALSVSLVEPAPAEGASVPLQLGGPAPSLR